MFLLAFWDPQPQYSTVRQRDDVQDTNGLTSVLCLLICGIMYRTLASSVAVPAVRLRLPRLVLQSPLGSQLELCLLLNSAQLSIRGQRQNHFVVVDVCCFMPTRWNISQEQDCTRINSAGSLSSAVVLLLWIARVDRRRTDSEHTEPPADQDWRIFRCRWYSGHRDRKLSR